MVNFLADNFSECVILAVLLLAMCPMLESKVAIPFALSSIIWGEKTLSPVATFFVAFGGSMLAGFVVLLIARWIKSKTSGFVHDKFTSFMQKKFNKQFENIGQKSSTFKKCLCIATFVAVPLPLTGAYTGSLIAGFCNLKFWQAFVSVLIGELISCGVMLLLCLLFENSAFYIFIATLILVVVFVIVDLLLKLFSFISGKHKKKKLAEEI